MGMNRYTNTELANINFIYSVAHGNGRVDVRLYGERYPKSRQPNHQTFIWLHQNLGEHVSLTVINNDTSVKSEIDLVALISIAAGTIRETPGIFKHVHQSISCQYHACVHANFNNFKHRL
ncbi:hypothetical protein TNCV_2247231 [Trichonephila clavipes]|nr:hypothetical protein TNCV_2247231 [Trichonephila clavipes]